MDPEYIDFLCSYLFEPLNCEYNRTQLNVQEMTQEYRDFINDQETFQNAINLLQRSWTNLSWGHKQEFLQLYPFFGNVLRKKTCSWAFIYQENPQKDFEDAMTELMRIGDSFFKSME